MIKHSSVQKLKIMHEMLDQELQYITGHFQSSELEQLQESNTRLKEFVPNKKYEIGNLEQKLNNLQKKMNNIIVDSDLSEQDEDLQRKSKPLKKSDIANHTPNFERFQLEKESLKKKQRYKYKSESEFTEQDQDKFKLPIRKKQAQLLQQRRIRVEQKLKAQNVRMQKNREIYGIQTPSTKIMLDNSKKMQDKISKKFKKKSQRNSHKSKQSIRSNAQQSLYRNNSKRSLKSIKSMKPVKKQLIQPISTYLGQLRASKASTKNQVTPEQKVELDKQQIKIINLQKSLKHYKLLAGRLQNELQQMKVIEIQYRKLKTNFAKSQQIRHQQRKIIDNFKNKMPK